MSGNVTELLRAWSEGNHEALDELVPLVDAELRKLSRHYLRGRPPPAEFQTTELVNEAFVRLIDRNGIDWQNRAHFFGIAASTMRQILVDDARRRFAAKRGGGEPDLRIDDTVVTARRDGGWELIALDEALSALADTDGGAARIVELRFFGGLTVEETAMVLGMSPASVKRGFRTAKIWLRRELDRRA